MAVSACYFQDLLATSVLPRKNLKEFQRSGSSKSLSREPLCLVSSRCFLFLPSFLAQSSLCFKLRCRHPPPPCLYVAFRAVTRAWVACVYEPLLAVYLTRTADCMRRPLVIYYPVRCAGTLSH